MRMYRFLFRTATREWTEIIQAPSMFEAAKQAKQLAQKRSKTMSAPISFSFHQVPTW